MSSAAKKRYTPEEYLALERQAPTKSEYYDGGIFAMAGTTREHNRIALNLASALNNQFTDRRCEAFVADLRVRVATTGLYTYPDIVAVCGEPVFEDDELDTLLNSTLIVEILSRSTAAYDRGVKFGHYRRLASLREYVLVAQDSVLVERYVRQGEEWVLSEFDRRADRLRLDSVGCEVPLDVIYAKLDLPEGGPGRDLGPDREGARPPRRAYPESSLAP